MHLLPDVSYFFGGVFLTNAIPHLVSGLMGRPFQSPFAKPPGKGLSSSKVNALWGWFNIVAAYFLVFHVGEFDIHSAADVASFGIGGLLNSLMLAHWFGKLHGGNSPG